jgi:hypothetical protein
MIDGLDHMGPVTAPEIVNGRIEAFIARQASSAMEDPYLNSAAVSCARMKKLFRIRVACRLHSMRLRKNQHWRAKPKRGRCTLPASNGFGDGAIHSLTTRRSTMQAQMQPELADAKVYAKCRGVQADPMGNRSATSSAVARSTSTRSSCPMACPR